jgi:hypothetical protein
MAELMAVYSPPMPRPAMNAGHQVDRQGQDEQPFSADLVGQAAEVERADHLPDQVDGAGERDLGRAHVQGLLEAARGDDLDLEAVQDPRDAEADHDGPVEPGPGQPVHARGDKAHLGCRRAGGTGSCHRFLPMSRALAKTFAHMWPAGYQQV